MHLRDYQQAAVDALWQSLRTPDAAPVMVLPTGAGKSVIIAHAAAQALQKDGRVLIVADREELLTQNHEKLRGLVGPRDVSMWAASLDRKEGWGKIVIGSLASIYKHTKALGKRNLVLIDEAHMVSHEGGMYRKLADGLLQINPKTRFAGFTATPYRMNGGVIYKGHNPLFNCIGYNISMRTLINQGYLSNLISAHALGSVIDVSKAKIHGGDYAKKDIETSLNEILVTALEELVIAGQSRKSWLLFLPGIQTASDCVDWLKAKGIKAAFIHGETERMQRRHIISRFRSGEIRALVNVDVLTKGFDAPNTDLVALLRATKSLTLYQQMVGRGSRLHPGKTDCLVLDYGGNIARLGPVDQIEIEEIKGKAKGGTAPFRFCTECGCANAMTNTNCVHCGADLPEIVKATGKNLRQKASRLAILSEPTQKSVISMQFGMVYAPNRPHRVKITYTLADHHKPCHIFLDFGGTGFALRQSKQWWLSNVKTTPPETAKDAYDILVGLADTMSFPSAIVVIQKSKHLNWVRSVFDEQTQPE
jgi:DNA repair protein RadD